MTQFNLTADAEGVRLDKWLADNEELSLTRSAIQNLISQGQIEVNGKVASKSYVIQMNDQIQVMLPELKELSVEAQDIPLDIVYQDADLLVVNKPKGMVVHPAAGNYDGTLVNALLYHCQGQLSGINGTIRPGIVHRIDKDTSGLLIVAKNDLAHQGLAHQIKEHSFTREYEAIVCGCFKEEKGMVDAPIGRHPNDRKKMCVIQKNSREAVTHYQVLQSFQKHTHLKLQLETGRTHQIRVHMAYVGHPVLGDAVYGKPYSNLQGQCLHAKKIGFVHPVSGEYLEFDSALPEYFRNILTKLH